MSFFSAEVDDVVVEDGALELVDGVLEVVGVELSTGVVVVGFVMLTEPLPTPDILSAVPW